METQPTQAEGSVYNDLSKDSFLNSKMQLSDLAKTLNSKINGLALAKIPTSQLGIICGHLVAAAPQVVFSILPKTIKLSSIKKNIADKKLIKQKKLLDEKKEKPNILYKNSIKPIGILNNHFYPWINAFLQFIIFIPSLKEMFFYTPKSFSSFNDFFDAYIEDQRVNKESTKYSTTDVIESLYSRFKDFFSSHKKVDLFSLLKKIMSLISSRTSALSNFGLDILAFYPSWQIEINNEDIILEEYLSKIIAYEMKSAITPKELLISFKWFFEKKSSSIESCKAPTLLFFYDNISSVYYELDAFIEYREDGLNGSYLTYLKVDGIWYQCDDTRVRKIRSNNLQIALLRSFVFHYKKIKIRENRRLV